MADQTLAKVLNFKIHDEGFQAIVTDWVDREIVHFGVVQTCPFCSLERLYRWPEVGEEGVQCSRCRRIFRPAPSRTGYWANFVGLDEVVFQALDNDLTEEVGLARWLQEHCSASSLALGVQWEIGELSVETDVIGVVDGELVIGEAKSSRGLRKGDQVERLARLAELTQARRLIFATSRAHWDKSVSTKLAALRSACSGVRVEVYRGLLSTGGPASDS